MLFRSAAGVQWTYGAMGNAKWSGVRLRDVLNRVGVGDDALEVVLDGADRGLLPSTPDFQKSLPMERALDENTLIVFEMNGRPLPHWNGAPARLVVRPQPWRLAPGRQVRDVVEPHELALVDQRHGAATLSHIAPSLSGNTGRRRSR